MHPIKDLDWPPISTRRWLGKRAGRQILSNLKIPNSRVFSYRTTSSNLCTSGRNQLIRKLCPLVQAQPDLINWICLLRKGVHNSISFFVGLRVCAFAFSRIAFGYRCFIELDYRSDLLRNRHLKATFSNRDPPCLAWLFEFAAPPYPATAPISIASDGSKRFELQNISTQAHSADRAVAG